MAVLLQPSEQAVRGTSQPAFCYLGQPLACRKAFSARFSAPRGFPYCLQKMGAVRKQRGKAGEWARTKMGSEHRPQWLQALCRDMFRSSSGGHTWLTLWCWNKIPLCVFIIAVRWLCGPWNARRKKAPATVYLQDQDLRRNQNSSWHRCTCLF